MTLVTLLRATPLKIAQRRSSALPDRRLSLPPDRRPKRDRRNSVLNRNLAPRLKPDRKSALRLNNTAHRPNSNAMRHEMMPRPNSMGMIFTPGPKHQRAS